MEGWFWGVAMLAKLPGFDSWLRPNFYFAILKLTNSRDLTFSRLNIMLALAIQLYHWILAADYKSCQANEVRELTTKLYVT